MKLVKLTLVGDHDIPVYINPEQVVSVQGFDRYTAINTTAQNPNGGVYHCNVKEPVSDVVGRLTV